MNKHDWLALVKFFGLILLFGGIVFGVISGKVIYAIPGALFVFGYFAYLAVWYDRQDREWDEIKNKRNKR